LLYLPQTSDPTEQVEKKVYELEHIGFAYGARTVIEDLSLVLEDGFFYGIVGPNGCGKTTLIDLLAGHIRPTKGMLRFKGRPLGHYSRKALARDVALVPQDFRINFPYTCREIVMMGRYPHIPRFSRPSAADRRIVDGVMRQAELSDFRRRCVHQLSGGERQRAVFARSLAQKTPVLLLDEATSNLDIRHAVTLLNLAAERVSDRFLVIAVMQDLNLAAMYCDRLICMHEGGIVSSGPLEAVLTSEMVRRVFQVNASVARNHTTGFLQVAIRKGAPP
jgi:iron complex transport system ATP-binding protein